MIFGLFKNSDDQKSIAKALYDQIVAQARQPEFYLSYNVADSTTGRFEMIIMHLYMFSHRLRFESEDKRQIGQAVFDYFMKDMDASLREQGVGDLSVPKKIKKMAEAFYGRLDAYDKARAESREALAAALSRNIYPDDEETKPQAYAIADYMLANETHLASQTTEAFAEGRLQFAGIAKYPEN
ncbi:ubiquinol-cytochrome C chaperone family protein [uncultured Cohaesibacter sp.]|uniref:ubiquinol-cytochrome C chaperone family protein n=1 Tax=uncultured Cohaesibacter sp. TaxID=1002546 RepID=UPI0029301E81|nr:ubiquinol-cytochrome C chaperone family protein [uncultured Cohaesibacter sp.]